MKKVLSVIICITMIAVAIPFTVSAAGDYTFTTSGDFNTAVYNTKVTEGKDVFYVGTTDPNGAVALVLKAGDIMNIPANVEFVVNAGSTLTVNGTIDNYGFIRCYGTITVRDGNITNRGSINIGEAANKIGVFNINNSIGLLTGPDSTTNVYGKMNVVGGSITSYGSIKIYGSLENGADRITTAGQGKVECQVRFPNLTPAGLSGVITVGYCISQSTDEYTDIAGVNFIPTGSESADVSIMVPFGTYLYIKAAINETEATDKYDDSKFPVSFNGTRLIFGTAGYSLCATTAGDVSYGIWGNGTQYLNTYRVLLPTGEGYSVYARNGETGTLSVTWGQSLAFKVEIDEQYDQSAYKVYIYDGYGWLGNPSTELLEGIEPVEPDQYGFYNLNTIQGDHQVYIVGVMKNDTINMVGNILETLKNVFNMIKELLEQFFAFFQNGNFPIQ